METARVVLSAVGAYAAYCIQFVCLVLIKKNFVPSEEGPEIWDTRGYRKGGQTQTSYITWIVLQVISMLNSRFSQRGIVVTAI